MSKQLEQTLQEQYSFYLYSMGVIYCASAGGMRVSIGTAIKMKKAGYKKGVQDIFIYEPRGQYHGMAVEIKCGSYPSQEQEEWRDKLLAKGYYAVIVPGKLDFFEARKFLEEETGRYLKGEILKKEA